MYLIQKMVDFHFLFQPFVCSHNFCLILENKHIKQNVFMGVLRNMWKIMKAQEWQGDPKQNGGVLILGPGNNISSNVWIFLNLSAPKPYASQNLKINLISGFVEFKN